MNAKAPRRKRATKDEQLIATEVMQTVFLLAKQAYLARQRFIAQGVPMAPIQHDARLRQVLGITDEPVIETPPKLGLVAATKDQVKRLLS